MTTSAHADREHPSTGRGLLGPSLTPREAELLTVTLQVLRETGYDKLTVDQVVAQAHASKTTVYRRWPSKAELVCAAFAHRIGGEHGLPRDTGTLRGDLLALAEMITRDAEEYGRTVAGILAAGKRSPRLREVLVNDLHRDRKEQVHGVLRRAVTRGEIVEEVISDDIWDVLPAYIMFRALQHKRPVPAETLRALIDEVLLPSLTRQPPALAVNHEPRRAAAQLLRRCVMACAGALDGQDGAKQGEHHCHNEAARIRQARTRSWRQGGTEDQRSR